MNGGFKMYSLGENALTIDFGDEISNEINNRVIWLSDFLYQHCFPGFIETVPAYASLTVFFDLIQVKKNFPEFPTAFDAVKYLVEKGLRNLKLADKKFSQLIEIPVNFSEEYALDLEFVCQSKDLSRNEFIKIFTASVYRVFMLGFLPGFAYMGETDEKIAVPRKQTPRLAVPKGSVGIAGKQTGIYPLESPGGWQIIGKTDVELFTPDKEIPTFLQTGNLVKFYPVEENYF